MSLISGRSAHSYLPSPVLIAAARQALALTCSRRSATELPGEHFLAGSAGRVGWPLLSSRGWELRGTFSILLGFASVTPLFLYPRSTRETHFSFLIYGAGFSKHRQEWHLQGGSHAGNASQRKGNKEGFWLDFFVIDWALWNESWAIWKMNLVWF